MAAWTVSGLTFADPASLSDASGLVAGRYWIGDVRVGTARYERRTYEFPGVDGVGVKSFGFRGRRVSGEVLYVANGLAALRAMLDADRAALADTTFSTTVPDGATLPNCQLEGLPDGPIQSAGGGLLISHGILSLRQLRET